MRKLTGCEGFILGIFVLLAIGVIVLAAFLSLGYLYRTECDHSPCGVHGTCEVKQGNGRNFPVCNCEKGYQGHTCEELKVIIKEYGAWRSPITSKMVNDAKTIINEVVYDPAIPGRIYWSEQRFKEEGRIVICSNDKGDPKETCYTDTKYSARSSVNGYGGGALLVYNSTIYFVNSRDQKIYSQMVPDGKAEVLVNSSKIYHADGSISPELNLIFYVREDNSVKPVITTISKVNINTGEETVIISGSDFYSSPRVSHDGKKLAWVQWNFPNMPWDNSTLCLANLTVDGSVVEGSIVKVSTGGAESVMEPKWSPKNELYYISDKTNWWNLYRVLEDGTSKIVIERDEEIGLPPWQMHLDYYNFYDRKIITTFNRYLQLIDMDTGVVQKIHTGYRSHFRIQTSSLGDIYVRAEHQTQPEALLRINIITLQVEIVKETQELELSAGYISTPREIQFPTGQDNDEVAYGYYYPPTNEDYAGPKNSTPPLVIRIHGGPTQATRDTFLMLFQFWTSRGWGILDVNYRGSTGYGREYRQKLYNKWGIIDVEDAVNGALHMVKEGHADIDRLVISGGSAGGLVVLCALTFRPGVFRAGASYYGISDIALLAGETHKFESRYIDQLIGPWPETNQTYYDRSPINFADNLTVPVIFFHGDKDTIVPMNQAVILHNVLKEKNIPTSLNIFKGEGHGFGKDKNKNAALDGENYFYSRVFGFLEHMDCDKGKVEIDNEDQLKKSQR
ncbi:unnamed protein product [Owenia fusiformis]|uniref:EGF-like domain-containing protein n=1 Tax=Owenia fusiformis TaxID=6347 RepID=A0A8S4N1R4_OWEFU|nr:unnamed protein product [Owenia fusiformis]